MSRVSVNVLSGCTFFKNELKWGLFRSVWANSLWLWTEWGRKRADCIVRKAEKSQYILIAFASELERKQPLPQSMCPKLYRVHCRKVSATEPQQRQKTEEKNQRAHLKFRELKPSEPELKHVTERDQGPVADHCPVPPRVGYGSALNLFSENDFTLDVSVFLDRVTVWIWRWWGLFIWD